MFHSIRWRTATVFALLILVCISGLSAYLSHLFKESYLDSLREQLTNQTQLIADSSAPYLSSSQAVINALAMRLGERIDGRVTIIATDRKVLGDSEENPAMMENHADRPEVIEAISKGMGSSIRYSATLGYDMMYVAVPMTINGGIAGIARVSLPLTEINKSLGDINRAIIWGALGAAVIAILLALQISKITAEPVKSLTQVSKRMAEGDLDQEIQVTSRDEVGQLAKAFNLMAARLKEMVSLVTAERDRMAVILSTMGDGILIVDGESRVTNICERVVFIVTGKIEEIGASRY